MVARRSGTRSSIPPPKDPRSIAVALIEPERKCADVVDERRVRQPFRTRSSLVALAWIAVGT